MDDIAIFALNASRDFGDRIAARLGLTLSNHEEREFEDGEHKARPLINVRGKDVFVIQSLYSDPQQSVNDKLCRLLFFVGALRDASADRISVIAPYLAYARKDQKSKTRDPVTTRYTAQLFEAIGTNRVVTLDVHNLAAFQNAFRCHTDHLTAKKLFVKYLRRLAQGTETVIVSPDAGGIKRAEALRKALSQSFGKPVTSAFMEKYRSKGVVTGESLVGEVADRAAIIVDDMIGTGTTLTRTIDVCQKHGATQIYAAASHGLFIEGSVVVVNHPALTQLLVTDTVPPFRLDRKILDGKVHILDSSELFAESIKRIHTGGSLVELLD